MPYQCVHCGEFYADATKELIVGCSVCHHRFFYFIKQEKYEKLLAQKNAAEIAQSTSEMQAHQIPILVELKDSDKKRVEEDVRDMIGIEEEPVILDLESVRILEPGKFEIDVVKLFKKETPIVYKLEEGKYIIDLGKIISGIKEKNEP